MHNSLEEMLEGVSHDDFTFWLSHQCTKALFLKLNIDLEELREHWSLGNYDEIQNLRASGQAFYLMSLEADLRTMLLEKSAQT